MILSCKSIYILALRYDKKPSFNSFKKLCSFMLQDLKRYSSVLEIVVRESFSFGTDHMCMRACVYVSVDAWVSSFVSIILIAICFIFSLRNGIFKIFYLRFYFYIFHLSQASSSCNKLGDSVTFWISNSVTCDLQITLALLLGCDYSQGVHGLGPVSSKPVLSLWWTTFFFMCLSDLI